MSATLAQQIVEFISNKYSINPEEIDTKESLVDQGVVDSLSFVEIALFLEKTCSVKINTDMITFENFDSIERIVAFVGSLPKV